MTPAEDLFEFNPPSVLDFQGLWPPSRKNFSRTQNSIDAFDFHSINCIYIICHIILLLQFFLWSTCLNCNNHKYINSFLRTQMPWNTFWPCSPYKVAMVNSFLTAVLAHLQTTFNPFWSKTCRKLDSDRTSSSWLTLSNAKCSQKTQLIEVKGASPIATHAKCQGILTRTSSSWLTRLVSWFLKVAPENDDSGCALLSYTSSHSQIPLYSSSQVIYTWEISLQHRNWKQYYVIGLKWGRTYVNLKGIGAPAS